MNSAGKKWKIWGNFLSVKASYDTNFNLLKA